MTKRFTLTCDQVPGVTLSDSWVDVLRWCICIMDPHDTRMAFVAGCLSRAAKGQNLTDRQAEACNAILMSLMRDMAAGILVCQNTPPDDCNTTIMNAVPGVKH